MTDLSKMEEQIRQVKFNIKFCLKNSYLINLNFEYKNGHKSYGSVGVDLARQNSSITLTWSNLNVNVPAEKSGIFSKKNLSPAKNILQNSKL